MGIGFRGKASALERQVELSFTNPWLFRTRTSLDLNAFYRFTETPAYVAEGIGTTANVGRTLSRHVFWKGGAQWTQEAHIGGERNIDRTKLLFTELLWDTRDDLFNARRGAMRRLEIQQAGGLLGGTNAFVRIRVEGRIFLPLSRHAVLAHAIQTGWLIPLRGGEIAVTQRFYAGGAQSVRGFREGAIGASGEDEPSGGRFLVTGQNELRIRPEKTWGGTCFMDLGAVWLDYRTIRWESIQIGVGFGLRFASPFGLIRCDLGWPAQSSVLLRQTQYYIGIGQAF
jgi:outer membrane translocation and assembly module TamA